MDASNHDRESFAEAFRVLSPRVYAYARARCGPEDAHDVTAETFLVAWRRWQDVPAERLPWLLVVARNTIANRRRRTARHDELAGALWDATRESHLVHPVDTTIVERHQLAAAFATLTEREREAVLLSAWDGLTGRDAAAVAGCSVRAFEVRLSRGRARLAQALADRPTTVPARPDAVPERSTSLSTGGDRS